MTGKKRTRFAGAPLIAALSLLAIPLLSVSQADAMYLTDGSREPSPGVYSNPRDGVCVVGLGLPGTANEGVLDVNTAIDNQKDCIVYTTPAIKALGQTACTGGAGNDGYRHAWSTSICVDNTTDKNPISRVDLDNTVPMCSAKGGVVLTTGLCVAHSWQYMSTKTGEAIPYRGTITPAGYKGRTSADQLGFCYAAMRMTSVVGPPAWTTANNGACPSYHNVATTASPGEWVAGTDNVMYQTQASYDAGLGFTFASSQCVYAYGVKGYLNANLTAATGSTATAPLCAGGTGSATAGTCVDLTGISTQGDCLAIGGSWDNWLPTLGGAAPGASSVAVATVPEASSIMKLDATTAIADGGGKFYSGTGSSCLKCHSDQSRSYAERYKPGYVDTGHKLSGDDPDYATVGDDWGLSGVQCEICHATGKPTAQDLGTIIYQTKVCVGGTLTAATPCVDDTPCTGGGVCTAGVPRAASGHNQTEYGSHVTGVCFTCHGTAGIPESVNPAGAIPVSYGELARTSKNLAPIANMFLNSPHGQYTGDSNKLSIITKTNYGSPFVGYVCRTSPNPSGTWNATTCPAAGHYWDGTTCRYTQTSCLAGPATNEWSTTPDLVAYPFAAVTGGVCGVVGSGSILTTVYRDGVAEKIHNADGPENEDCTNPSNGTPSGAGGVWVQEGEAAGTTGGVAYSASNQGNCMTCHDVHWSLESADPEAEPLRRECTTCHGKNLAAMAHPQGAGTPLEEMATDPAVACEICHMPGREHLFRISTSATYSAFPLASLTGTANMNTAADGSYTNAAWVDLDQACGQCHGGGTVQVSNAGDSTSGSKIVANVGSTTGFVAGARVSVAGAGAAGADLETLVASVDSATQLTLAATAETTVAGAAVKQNPTKNGGAYMTKTQLAALARGIHGDAPIVSFGYTLGSPNTLTVNVDGSASSCSGGACDAYDWDWGDGTAHGSGAAASHTFAAPGDQVITLTVEEFGVNEGSLTKKVTVYAPDLGPTVGGTCSFDANTWTETVTDTSSDDNGIAQVTVNWGDGSVLSSDKVAPYGPFSHAFTKTGTFTIAHKAIDTIGQQSSTTCTASPAYFSISGTVKNKLGTANLASAVVTVKKSGVVVKTVYTSATGTFSA
ncbi:MAG: hypothetical protein HY899_15255, partial [Deltaproteobacteria bacterium]|nr:hypothetical protein [Deltaproteobacteria bacterium]